jgi:ASC-1-like (ASCH) protein
MEHVMKLQAAPFDKIKEGVKTIEVRLYDEKRREVQLGDTITFKREPEQTETVRAEVVGLLRYRSFADLANDFPASSFGHSDKDDLLKSIYSFYTKEQETQYGVLGIRIRLIG